MLNHRPKCHSKVVNKHNWEVKKTTLLCRFELLQFGKYDNFRQLEQLPQTSCFPHCNCNYIYIKDFKIR